MLLLVSPKVLPPTTKAATVVRMYGFPAKTVIVFKTPANIIPAIAKNRPAIAYVVVRYRSTGTASIYAARALVPAATNRRPIGVRDSMVPVAMVTAIKSTKIVGTPSTLLYEKSISD